LTLSLPVTSIAEIDIIRAETMTLAENRPAASAEETIAYIQWSPIVAGAFAAAALSFVLITFATAVGLAVSSSAPTWRDASFALWFLSGIVVFLIALASFGLGGYIAGLMRTPLGDGAPKQQTELRDGTHGLIVWALAVVISALLAAATASALISRTATNTAASGGSSAESLIAPELDRLFRSERRPPDVNLSNDRAEAGRILLTTSSHQGLTSDDRSYLVRLVAARTGLSPGDAERRVDDVAARAKTAISRARHSAVIVAFLTGAGLLLGAATAWVAACAGGRDRDGRTVHHFMYEFWREGTAHGSPSR
jgi:hypothetical protein